MSLTSPEPGAPTPYAEAVKAYGKYFLVKKIAEGGMAEIFLAKQVGAEGFERNVVIKRMLAHLSQVPDFVGMFLDEARLAARLAHSNIVQINDLGLAEGCYYICMEYLPGEDFSTVLRTASKRREYVPLNVVARVIIDAAHGLHFAHEFSDETGKPLNVVHRDISPSNIYVTYQGAAKLLDFGIAKAESRVTQTTAGVVKGKYMYMAPEQAATGNVDRRADVFSLGVTLYEALTNIRPFARDSDLAILNAVLKGDFQAPRQLRPDLPPELEAIVLKAMSLKKEARYPTAGAFAGDLEMYLGASTSGSGGTQVSSYLRLLFGEQRVTEKSRIPSLTSLAQSGIEVPGLPDPNAPTTDKSAPNLKSPATESKTVMSSGRKEGVSRSWFLVAGALGLILGAGGLVAARYLRPEPAVVAPPQPPQTPPPVVATVKPPEPAVTPPPPVVKPADPTPTPRPPHDPPARAVILQPVDVSAVVRKNYSSIMSCFESFKSELPADEGTTKITFTIRNAGSVEGASTLGQLSGTRVGKCLEQRINHLRFPLNRNNGLVFSLPLQYRVER